jgi:hypothetical protein
MPWVDKGDQSTPLGIGNRQLIIVYMMAQKTYFITSLIYYRWPNFFEVIIVYMMAQKTYFITSLIYYRWPNFFEVFLIFFYFWNFSDCDISCAYICINDLQWWWTFVIIYREDEHSLLFSVDEHSLFFTSRMNIRYYLQWRWTIVII